MSDQTKIAFKLLQSVKEKEALINKEVGKLQELKGYLNNSRSIIEGEKKALEDWSKKLRYAQLRMEKVLEEKKIDKESIGL